MIRNLKVLGLAVVALVAMSAVMATAASAGNLTASSYPSTLTGTQVGEHVFTVEHGATVKCPVANFHGVLASPGGPTVSNVSAEYKGTGEKSCTAFGFLSATIHMNGCTYTFHDVNTINAHEHSGTADVVCPEGKVITVVAGTCEVQIGSQTGLSPVFFRIDTEATPDDLTLEPAITGGITYNKTKDGFGCPLTGLGHNSNGAYSGNTTVIGEDPINGEKDTLSLS